MSFLARLFGPRTDDPVDEGGLDADEGVDTTGAVSARAERICRELGAFREEVVARLDEASSLTGEEVMEVGRAVGDIVTVAQSHMQEIKLSLTDLTDRSRDDTISAAVDRQNIVFSEYLETMRSWCMKQGEMARSAAAASEDIVAAGATIAKIASQAQILTLNAHIESSRLGRAGAGFTVIANEMQALSREIARTNERVGEMATNLATSLPEIAGMAEQIQGRSESFRGDFERIMDDVSDSNCRLESTLTDSLRQGDVHLDQILAQSYAALSHLQYQDPMIQNLQRIDSLMGELQGRVQAELGIDAPIAEAKYVPNLSDKMQDAGPPDDDQLSEGEMLLF